MDSVVVGIVRNVYNWLSYGVVGNSVCRTTGSEPPNSSPSAYKGRAFRFQRTFLHTVARQPS